MSASTCSPPVREAVGACHVFLHMGTRFSSFWGLFSYQMDCNIRPGEIDHL